MDMTNKKLLVTASFHRCSFISLLLGRENATGGPRSVKKNEIPIQKVWVNSHTDKNKYLSSSVKCVGAHSPKKYESE